jgi:predicted DNA-binding protein YlxM (UPF0122 family)
MNTIRLTPQEKKQLAEVKRELLTDRHATFTSYARCWDKIDKVAAKYNTDRQTIYDSI